MGEKRRLRGRVVGICAVFACFTRISTEQRGIYCQQIGDSNSSGLIISNPKGLRNKTFDIL